MTDHHSQSQGEQRLDEFAQVDLEATRSTIHIQNQGKQPLNEVPQVLDLEVTG